MKKWILLLVAFDLGLTLKAIDKKDVETRTARVNYSVSSNDLIDINAKYTDLTIESWDKSEVLVEATIRFDGKMTDKMQQFLDNFEEEVKSNISEDPGSLIIRTNLDEPNKFQMGSKYFGIIVDFSEDELKLEYSLKVPFRNELKIANSYREVKLLGAFDEVEIDQYSGELEVGDIKKANIKLKYGSASFGRINQAEMELYEQEVSADQIDELEIDTKYSEINIKQLGDMEIKSYETDFEIGSLAIIEGDLKYGNLEITESLKEGKLTTYEFDIEANEIGKLTFESGKYGQLEAEKVEELRIIQSYEDDFEISTMGSFQADECKYCNINIDRLTDAFKLYGYEGEINIKQLEPGVSSVYIDGKYIETSLGIDAVPYKLVVDTKYGKTNIDKSSPKVKRYIKEGDRLEVEVVSGSSQASPVSITVKGYEMDLELNE